MIIKVLGPGCPRCQQTEQLVRDACAEAGVAADIQKIKDVMEIAKHGVLGTPAIIIDGKVKSVGKVPAKSEIVAWVREENKN